MARVEPFEAKSLIKYTEQYCSHLMVLVTTQNMASANCDSVSNFNWSERTHKMQVGHKVWQEWFRCKAKKSVEQWTKKIFAIAKCPLHLDSKWNRSFLIIFVYNISLNFFSLANIMNIPAVIASSLYSKIIRMLTHTREIPTRSIWVFKVHSRPNLFHEKYQNFGECILRPTHRPFVAFQQ